MAAFLAWIHYDLEGHWQHRKAQHGKRLEEKRTLVDAKAKRQHQETVDEYRPFS